MLFRLVTKFRPSSATPLSNCQSFQAIRFKIVLLLVLLYFSLDNVFVFVRKVIMIAAGSGIAPFRSFWQERQRQAQVCHDPPIIVIFDVSLSNKQPRLSSLHVQATWALGPTVLFFGCRRENMDLLRKETDKFRFFFFFCQRTSFSHPVVIFSS